MPVRPRNNLPPDSQPWAREVEKRIDQLEIENERFNQDVTNSFKTLNSSMNLLNEQVLALPMILTAGSANTGFGLGAGWNPITQITVSKPANRTIARVFAVGGAAAVDTTTGGITVCSARILINDVASPTFEPAKDAGASAVNNILTPMFTRTISPISDPVVVRLELNPANAAAFPARGSNYGVLNIIVSYFR